MEKKSIEFDWENKMIIGEVSKKSGVSAKLIRHYESIGLIPKASRSFSGYRTYSENDVHVLKFIKRSRNLGFSMDEIKKLVSLWKNKKRQSQEVKKLAERHINTLELKIAELNSIVTTLKHLSHCCKGNDRPDCPILEDLERV